MISFSTHSQRAFQSSNNHSGPQSMRGLIALHCVSPSLLEDMLKHLLYEVNLCFPGDECSPLPFHMFIFCLDIFSCEISILTFAHFC